MTSWITQDTRRYSAKLSCSVGLQEMQCPLEKLKDVTYGI